MIPAASFRSRVSFILLGLVLLAAKVDMHAVAPASRAEFAIAKVSESSIVRNLTPAEMAADQHAHIALGLRNKTELDARVAHGEIISREEMAARYYPTRETWASVAAWAAGQGLAVAPEDLTHMTVFTHGTVAQVGRAFQTRFARVRGTDRREYSSAIDAPSMPLEVSAPVTGIMALQPHLRRKPHAVYTTIGSGHATPPQFIRDWYNATSVGDGSGQVIGIWGYDNPPNSTDLMNYWWKIGSGHTMSDISVYNPDNLPPCADTEFDGAGFEMTLDTEVASGLCSGANIRIYCVGNEGSLAAQVLKDLAAGIPVRQLATSFGAPETLNGGDGPAAAQYFASLSQYFEALTAQGVTCFAASGDGGSNENGHGSGYDPSGALAPEYPASDPYVTGVGGTDVNLLYNSTGTTITGVQSEFAWTPETGVVSNGQLVPSVPINSSCSGGGISAVIARPSWQQGPGVPAGAMRCVPDVAAGPANGNGLYLYIGGDATAGGTSVSSPIWAAMCACMNQALAAKGQGPIGLLGPKLYPLTGTPALKAMAKGYFETYAGTSIAFSGPNDVIVSDGPSTNGAYAVGPNYNCITGLGTPNVARILDALLSASSVPFVRSGPQAQSVNAGAAVTLSVDCGGGGLSYQWALNGSPIEGATNATLVYPAIAAYQAGNYSCTITNSYGSVSTSATAVAVASNARLVDISARANVGTGDNVLIAGLWISTDSQSVPKNILVRCMGPSIGQAPFNVSGTLANTSMSFYKSETELVSEQGWGATTLLQSYGPTAGYTFTSASQNLMAILGAFAPYEVGSGDAAFFTTLPAINQGYTSICKGTGSTTGVALVEVYDADSAFGVTNNSARIVDLSARANVGTGTNILVGGFWIAGTTSETVLIRGIGPALTALGVSGALPSPIITLFDSNDVPIASNSGWANSPVIQSWASQGGAANPNNPTSGSNVSNLTAPWNMQVGLEPATSSLMASLGAFAPTSGDSAMVVTLPPGGYTFEVTGANGSTGVALAEIYEVQ